MAKTQVERISFWEALGPFENPVRRGRRTGLGISHSPETSPIDVTATCAGKNGGTIGWKEFTPQANGFYELMFTVPEPEAVAYALCYLFAVKPGTVDLKFGPYHGLKVLVNGTVVGEVPPGDYDPLGKPFVFSATLRAGRNELLVKCEHVAGGWGFFFDTATVRPRFGEYLRQEASERARHFKQPPGTLPELRRWQKQTRADLMRLMAFPQPPVPLTVTTTEVVDCGAYVRHRLYIQTEANWEVPALLLIPKTATAESPAKALVCLHGHGHGKADIIDDFDFPNLGDGGSSEYDYGRRFAAAGYVVIAPDSRAFGELGDLACGSAYALANAIGRPLVGMRVWDALRALDVLLARPEVDQARVGCTGLSWGGTHTAYLAMIEPRLKAALVSGYFSDFYDILFRTPMCPCQYLPGVVDKYDFSDLLFGLAAPRPLYIQNGRLDTLYTPDRVRAAFRRGWRIYDALGVSDHATLEMHELAHVYRFDAALAWFEKVL